MALIGNRSICHCWQNKIISANTTMYNNSKLLTVNGSPLTVFLKGFSLLEAVQMVNLVTDCGGRVVPRPDRETMVLSPPRSSLTTLGRFSSDWLHDCIVNSEVMNPINYVLSPNDNSSESANKVECIDMVEEIHPQIVPPPGRSDTGPSDSRTVVTGRAAVTTTIESSSNVPGVQTSVNSETADERTTGRNTEAAGSQRRRVWLKLANVNTDKFLVNVEEVRGLSRNLTADLPDIINIVDSINYAVLNDRISKVQATICSEICIIRFTPTGGEQPTSFAASCRYLNDSHQIGVVRTSSKQIEALYVLACSSPSQLPSTLTSLIGSRVDTWPPSLLGVIVSNQSRRPGPSRESAALRGTVPTNSVNPSPPSTTSGVGVTMNDGREIPSSTGVGMIIQDVTSRTPPPPRLYRFDEPAPDERENAIDQSNLKKISGVKSKDCSKVSSSSSVTDLIRSQKKHSLRRLRDKIRKSPEFSDDENRKIMEYLIENKAFARCLKRPIWSAMASDGIFTKPYRSATALYEHFQSNLQYRYRDYVVDPNVLQKFEKFCNKGQLNITNAPYSVEEDRRIIKYIVKNNFYNKTGGRKIWEALEAKRIFVQPYRTSEGLRWRYQNILRENLGFYVEDPEILGKFRR